ncbi:MAG: UDP-3-O-(3-hydroxymyristoyl)glucosamine N-acyltransferase [Gemmatimonadetes bacterium]|nr:UDP-3-O-(3-hydroxymyristoyl)glucosamine N-acyltransferase [Gemmatimonadota bacterium]
MVLTAGAVARLVDGELIGLEDVELVGVAPLDRAGPRELALLASARYLPYLRGSTAGAVLMTPRFRTLTAGPATRIVVPDAHRALRAVLAALYPKPNPAWGVHPSARLGRGIWWEGRIALGPHATLGAQVRLGPDCIVEAGAVIGDGVRLGSRCRVGEHAVLHAGTVAGDRVVIHAGARVGGEGFRFTPSGDGKEQVSHLERLPHVGRCVLGDDVEVGANTTIDRGSVGDTVVGPGTKIDNLVQVAHNVRIGTRCVIMAQVGIAGSTVIEDHVILAGQAGLADHLTVHRGARVAAQGGVIGDVPAGATVSGYPARSHHEVLRQAAALRRLTPIVHRLERIAHHDAHA